ncbi:hypothetical protein [Paenibacillus koleovorans]|uniref:hypothetical protein n=1 Tax=Paenibacillus koleovorans TaxID=121608 RepID=UPI0013E2DA35|nr:hypothetical protein [Paenibacillus koleovorans]
MKKRTICKSFMDTREEAAVDDAAETRYRLLKDPQFVGGVYLKTPNRIVALGIVLVMALLLYGILKYRIRQQLDQQEKPFESRAEAGITSQRVKCCS